MKKIITLVALLSIPYAHGMTKEKMKTLVVSPTTCQIVSAIIGLVSSPFIKSFVPQNNAFTIGLTLAGIGGGLFFQHRYLKPAVDAYEKSSKVDEPIPVMQALTTVALSSLGYAVILSRPDLVKSGLETLGRAKLDNVAKAAASAALLGHLASVALD